MEAKDAKSFTQSVINIFRLNMFEQTLNAKKAKKRGPTTKGSSSKTTIKERERVKKLKRLVLRRKEEQKKRKLWKEYLVKLAKGKLTKGEKPPF